MIVIIDGKPVTVHNDVRVLWDTDDSTAVQLAAMHDGVVIDVFEDGESVATTQWRPADLEDLCM